MCTVSFVPHREGFLLAMNRDESRQRPVALPPRLVAAGDTGRALYPSEPSGGTWIGVNDSGLCFALINWYAIRLQPGFGGVSRGTLIPALLGSTAFGEARSLLDRAPISEMAPFRLMIFALKERVASEFRWNQERLLQEPRPWAAQHWFSSGLDEPRAQRERGAVCRAASPPPMDDEASCRDWLQRLHSSHEPHRLGGGPFSVCMHREDAATVSFTEIAMTGRAATMSYCDGPLCAKPACTHAETLEFRPAALR